jgi:hypothetical protein
MPSRLSIRLATGADRFAKNVGDLDAEKIRDDQTELPFDQLTKQAHSFLLASIERLRLRARFAERFVEIIGDIFDVKLSGHREFLGKA